MTAITDFYDPVRFLLGDHDETNYQYKDPALLRGLRTIIKGGRIPAFTLDGTSNNINPDVTNPNDYMLISAHAANGFLAGRPDAMTFRTRAFSASESRNREQLFDLRKLIYDLENGDMFSGWQNFASWLEGFAGVRKSWLNFVSVDVQAPFTSVTVSAAGVTTNTR